MLETVKAELKEKTGDAKLIDNLFYSFQKISEKFVAQKPVDLLQNTGLFVESALRVAEHLVSGSHTPLSSDLNVNSCIRSLEQASGSEGLRIHAARLSRAIFDLRTRKTGVHLKAVDPQAIDASLIFNISTWILIEILKEGGVTNPEESINLLFAKKIPLVQNVGDILRTTNPKLNGAQRILLLLYSSPGGLTEEQLLIRTKQKIKNLNHLRKNLKSMESRDLVHQLPSSSWVIFGIGSSEAERLIKEFS